MTTRRLRLLSANIQAGSSTRGYHDYVARSWSHVCRRKQARRLDPLPNWPPPQIVGLQELILAACFRFTTRLLQAERAGFASGAPAQPRWRRGVQRQWLLSKLEPRLVENHALPGRVNGRGYCWRPSVATTMR